MPRRKRYCETGGIFCKESCLVDGCTSCRLQGMLEEGDRCERLHRERENERAGRWFADNGWHCDTLFMRGVRYSAEGHEIIRDARGIMHNGRRLHTKEDMAESLANVLPEWLIERVTREVIL